MHPRHEHLTASLDDRDAALARRIEIARQSGVPEAPLARWAEGRKEQASGMSGPLDVARDLLPGVVVETDLGAWHVYETPGHAPSHVVLHQPERRLLISGDHVLGRISLYFDHGWTPDPVREFLDSLDVVDGLDARLTLSGHGRPFTDLRGHVDGQPGAGARAARRRARRAGRARRGDRVRPAAGRLRRQADAGDRGVAADEDALLPRAPGGDRARAARPEPTRCAGRAA